jgi:HlyD family secretion protein/adhesin transport system membrane fusion protein
MTTKNSEKNPYLAQSILLEEAGTPRLVRFGMIAVIVVVSAFLGWSSITRIDEVARSQGAIIPSGRIQAIQHLEGGIISEILIEEGTEVAAGQPLLRLDSVQAQAEMMNYKARRASLVLTLARLRALAEDGEVTFPEVDEGYGHMVADQRAIFLGQVGAHEARRAVLREQVATLEREIDALQSEIGTARDNLAIVTEELKMRRKLTDKGLSSKLRMLESELQVSNADGSVKQKQAEQRTARQSLAEARRRIVKLEAEKRETALSQMVKVIESLAQTEETLARLEDRVARLEVRAPVGGLVKGLRVNTVGGVIEPGQILMEVVPVDRELIAEVRIDVRDIGHVRPGLPAVMKFTSYDFARYGSVRGELRSISASTFADENGQPFYKGFVQLAKAYVGDDPSRFMLTPGMTLQAEIQTGNKSLLQYLLKPIYRSLEAGFGER